MANIHPNTAIVAEIGINHNGCTETACQLIMAAHQAGADAVKFQHFDVNTLYTPGHKCIETLRPYQLTTETLSELVEMARDLDLGVVITPFCRETSSSAADLRPDYLKVSSGDISNPLLINSVINTGCRYIVSTGMSNINTIKAALDLMGDNRPDYWLHCVSSYPTPEYECNLNAMKTLARITDANVGWSDHCQTEATCIVAVAAGAKMIERHITLDTNQEGGDHHCSSDPIAFSLMVHSIRAVERTLGSPAKAVQMSEQDLAFVAQRGLYAAETLKAGHTITEGDVIALRPISTFMANDIDQLIGKTLQMDICKGTEFTHASIEEREEAEC